MEKSTQRPITVARLRSKPTRDGRARRIGGTGVITGSPPNLVVLNVLDSAYGEGVSPLTYASWMGFCVPLMVVKLRWRAGRMRAGTALLDVRGGGGADIVGDRPP